MKRLESGLLVPDSDDISTSALPTGTISMSEVNVELGKSSTALISLNDSDVRDLAGKSSGTISMNDLRGKSAVQETIFTGTVASGGAAQAYCGRNSSNTGWSYGSASPLTHFGHDVYFFYLLTGTVYQNPVFEFSFYGNVPATELTEIRISSPISRTLNRSTHSFTDYGTVASAPTVASGNCCRFHVSSGSVFGGGYTNFRWYNNFNNGTTGSLNITAVKE